jgi:haloacetate dehalogenase
MSEATKTAEVNGQSIAYEVSGSGPPLLLLHGFPQTRAMWRHVVPLLANHFTVVTADLRGYGESSKPQGTAAYSFRHMAADQHALMAHLGYDQFHLVGHDRGGRTAHRLALDSAEAVLSLTVMDIIPTHLLLDNPTKEVAKAYYHWFFLAQPNPLPETLIGHDPDHYFQGCLTGWGAAKIEDFDPVALDAYRKSWRKAETIQAMCNDYRAAIEYDFALDAADLDRRVTCPSLVMYGQDGVMAKLYNVPATWADRLADITAQAIPGGHFFVDHEPQETAEALLGFLLTVKSS